MTRLKHSFTATRSLYIQSMGQDDVTSRLVGWFVGLRRGGWLRVALRPRDGVVFRMDEGKGRQLVSGVLYSPSNVEVGIAISFCCTHGARP